MNELFQTRDYKDWIRTQVSANETVRGYRTQLAAAAGCQKSYLSQVLNAHLHLTPEHAMGLSHFWNFSEDQTDYFLDLVNFARAGSEILRKRIRARLEQCARKQEDLSHRLKRPRLLETEHEAQYYSSWVWSAVHIAVGITQFQSIETIAERLSLSKEMVRDTLATLREMGLVNEERGKWTIGTRHLHLPRTASINTMNHNIWRGRAVLDAQKPRGDGLHYTVVFSHSNSDTEKLKSLGVELIEKARDIFVPSPAENLSCLCLDFFPV